MGFEPIVIESIKKHRNKLKARKVQFIFPLLLGGAALVVMEVATLASRNHDSIDVTIFIILALSIILAVIVIAFSIRKANQEFKEYTGRQAGTTKGSRKFRDALEGVCIGTGVTPPRLMVVRDDNTNAFAFVDEIGSTYIAVTEGMLEAPLSIHEINAIMAHELSHIIIGNNIREPCLSDIEYYPGFFYGPGILYSVIGFLMLGLILIHKFIGITSTAGSSLFVIVIALLIGSVFILRSLLERGVFDRLAVKGLDSLHIEDDLLADSIAVKITMNPDALESAINTVKDINESREHRSEGPGIDEIQPKTPDFLTKYLFLGPPGSLTAYHQRTSGDTTEQTTPQLPVKSKKTTRDPTDERIKNLEFIKRDRWPAFER